MCERTFTICGLNIAQFTLGRHSTKLSHISHYLAKTSTRQQSVLFLVVLESVNAFISEYANNAIGFTAYRSTTYDVVNDAACLFDEEVFDNDGAYDTSSGVFTCPVSGMYFFITTLYMGQNSGWYADSELQDSTGTKTLGGIFNNNAHTLQSTNQAVFQCDAGATVRVINRSDNTRRLAGTEGGRPMSTFSGFLISLT